MQSTACPNESTEKPRSRQSPKIEVPLLQRAALSPNEFAALFGKHTTWGYRAIYAGKVKVIKDLGNTLIPISEVNRLLAGAEVLS